MNVANKWRIALFALIACSVLTQFAFAAETADEKLQAVKSLLDPIQLQWRCKAGDFPNVQQPNFDDSAWNVHGPSEFQWGEGPLAWLRTTVTVPAKACGVPIAGSRITLKCGVDDDGVIYVNGKEVSKFHWDEGSVVLTEKAVPGEKFVIAVKNINIGGPGRLLSSSIEISALADFRSAAGTFLDAYAAAAAAMAAVVPAEAAPYQKRIASALDQIDFAAMESGDRNAFIASLTRGEAELRKVNSEVCAGITCSLVGHAHIDLEWLWRWPETVDVCNNTFSTMCRLMDEYPFVFSQSQVAVYDEMRRSSPELYAKMKDRFKRGQWDVSTACMWSEGDTNMSSGEGLVRSLMLGKRYIMREFGVEPTVGWLPDNFGHTWTLPQIFAKSGVKYLCFMRTGIGKPVFWWQGPDGSRVLAYNFPDYNGGIDANDLAARALTFAKDTGVRDYMKPYGVGDHGGGPTKEALDVAVAIQKRTDYPQAKFSSAAGYMDGIAKSGAKFPVHASELNSIFEGCYTSHADAKLYNRECENALASSEVFSSIANGYGVKYPAAGFKSSWQKTCFNEFHDILCGSGIHGVYEDTKLAHEQVMKQTSAARDAGLAALTAKINTKGKGVPVVVFNPLGWSRTESVTLASPFFGENTHVRMTDASGKSYPGKTLGDKLTFTARDVPAMGYKVFWATRVSKPVASGVSFDGPVIANQYFRVRVEPKLGVITGIYDKVNKRNVMVPRQYSDVLQILSEGPTGMSAWMIGAIQDTKDLVGNSEVVQIDAGPAKASVTFDHRYSKSLFTQEVVLYDGIPRIDIRMTADWHEPWSQGTLAPMLKAAFSADLKNPKATFEIPFGSIERPRDGREVVGQKWIDLSDADYGVSLLNDCKYGFDVRDNTMRISLLRSSYDPDPNPDEGVHEATYSLYPHKGDWREAGTTRRGYEFNEPLVARVAAAHSGALPASKSYLSVEPANIVATALKMAEDGDGLVLRFYETDGKPCEVLVRTSLPVKHYVETDLMERPIGKKGSIKDGVFRVKTGKCEIKTYKLLR